MDICFLTRLLIVSYRLKKKALSASKKCEIKKKNCLKEIKVFKNKI